MFFLLLWWPVWVEGPELLKQAHRGKGALRQRAWSNAGRGGSQARMLATLKPKKSSCARASDRVIATLRHRGGCPIIPSWSLVEKGQLCTPLATAHSSYGGSGGTGGIYHTLASLVNLQYVVSFLGILLVTISEKRWRRTVSVMNQDPAVAFDPEPWNLLSLPPQFYICFPLMAFQVAWGWDNTSLLSWGVWDPPLAMVNTLVT